MLTSRMAFRLLGDPALERYMMRWQLPHYEGLETLPRAIYCNKFMVGPLTDVFVEISKEKIGYLIRTYDGCFNIRKKRGATSQSLHSWGLAVDINASWNRMGYKPTMSPELVAIFKKHGFDWGGDWKTPDGMHFQLNEKLIKL